MSYSGERDNFAPHMALVPMVIAIIFCGNKT